MAQISAVLDEMLLLVEFMKDYEMLGTQRGAHSYADTVLPGLAFLSQHLNCTRISWWHCCF